MYSFRFDFFNLFNNILIAYLYGNHFHNQINAASTTVWPRGNIPYLIDEYSFDKVLRDRIRGYLEEVSDSTKLTFVELQQPPSDENIRWVFFINRRGLLPCTDYRHSDFTNTGVQRVVVGYDCVGPDGSAALASTVLALAGVPPQHNAPDRDKYIKIMKENILPDKLHLFRVVAKEDWPFKDFQYDYTSAGHYTDFKYSKNGHITIKSQNYSSKVPFEEIANLSDIDIEKIKFIYENSKLLSPESKMCDKLYFRPRKKSLKVTSTSPFANELKEILGGMPDVDTDE